MGAVIGASGDAQSLDDISVADAKQGPPSLLQAHEVDQLLDHWIGLLAQRENERREGRFGLHHMEPESRLLLSQRLGLTRERVRQVQNDALHKLKRYLVSHSISSQSLL